MISIWQQQLRRHPRALDFVGAALLWLASVPGTTISAGGAPQPPRWWPGVVLTGVSCAALLWRRHHPRATVLVAAGVAMATAALGYTLTVLLLAPLMAALFTLADRTDRSTTTRFTGVVVVLVVVTALIAGPADEPVAFKAISPVAWLLLPAALGSTARFRRAYLESMRARAEYAERARDQEARHRVMEERMRIARELHDVVAHHLALANAQAGTVAHLVRTRPEQAEKMVTELAGTTSAALREMKATVGLLRQADDPDTPLDPAPGLDRLGELTASFAAAGLTVTVEVEGRPRPLAAGADLTAYRIVQEALTNVTKHAGTPTAEVLLRYSHNRVTISITNDVAGPSSASIADSSGFGLIGMRERALSAGGLLRAGNRPAGGFEVITELPLPDQPLTGDRAS
ncbi:histidine kinase [Winogradskya consettensis]|uniref:histidine kinase n=1 Tax=Winogradskya consettensis TaxID=113560 RepID=A0A919T2V5_9ACTN|nr:sensor histidine kinase [Actinoplanes consettensis]GIM82260.1 two-component sensor histidine kinase [Actinoplanes consettensis]